MLIINLIFLLVGVNSQPTLSPIPGNNGTLVEVQSNVVPNPVALEMLKEYISIDTSHPIPGASQTSANYGAAKEFIINYAKQLGLTYTIFECKPNKPLITIKYPGTNPNLPSILFNSHIDVVAADPKFWKYPPFVPTLDKDASGATILYGRGTQDTKATGIVYMEALRALKAQNFKPERNLYVVFSPDEEIGGKDGIQCWTKSEQFASLNLGFAFDEGGTSGKDDVYSATYSERARWLFQATANGESGHASMFVKDLASDKIEKFHSYIKKFRNEQEALADPNNTWDGKVTSVNLNLIQGGIGVNVIPPQVNYTYDMRVSPLQNPNELYKKIILWAYCSKVTVTFMERDRIFSTENLTQNPFFIKLNQLAQQKFNARVEPLLLPAVSDSRFLREAGIPTIGFAAYRAMPLMHHRNNEFIKLDSFYEAIQYFIQAIPKLATE